MKKETLTTENKKPLLNLKTANIIFAIFLGYKFRKETEIIDNKPVVKKIFNINGIDCKTNELNFHLDKNNLFKIHSLMVKYGYIITIKNETVLIKHQEFKILIKDSMFSNEKLFSHKLFYCYALAINKGILAFKEKNQKTIVSSN